MAEEAINPVLEHLKSMRSEMREIKDILNEQGHRLNRIELSVASGRREQAGDAENVAYLGIRVDKLTEEIDRIKRRLELID